MDGFGGVKRGELTAAAELLGPSARQNRRERRASLRSLVPFDGGQHDGFEGRGPTCMRMVADRRRDAMDAGEAPRGGDDGGRVRRVRAVGGGAGRAAALGAERHAIDWHDEHPRRPTRFGRAMAKPEVELILARGPPAASDRARGDRRVEWRHAVFQDPLVKEPRLRGTKTAAEEDGRVAGAGGRAGGVGPPLRLRPG